MKDSKSILIIGAGGIGGLLTQHVVRVIVFSGLTKQVGNLEVTLMDGDGVESRNLPHQQFGHSDQLLPKVVAIQRRLEATGMTIERGIQMTVIAENFTAETDLSEYDLVVVAVDSEEPRNLVHSNAEQWLDLRARGDGFVMWSYQDAPLILDNLPKLPVGTSTSCQLDDAIATGNIQFGFALAAAHGAQWIVQWLRGANVPAGRMYSAHMGELPMPMIQEKVIE